MIKDAVTFSQYIPRALLLTVVLGMAYLFWEDNLGHVGRRLIGLLRRGWMTAYLFDVAFLLMTAVLSRKITAPLNNVWSHFGFRADTGWNLEIIENILIFVPYSFLFLQAFRPPHPVKASLLATACATLFIELCQLVFSVGEFQFSDLFHNLLGGAIGCGVWLLVQGIRRKWQENRRRG